MPSQASLPFLPGKATKAVVYALVALLAMPAPLVSWAANHPLSAVADVNTLDYVVNVDWDFDRPPTQLNNPGQVLDRAYITNVLRVAAQAKFTMTEGRHRIGNVFVYPNKRFGTNVDIQMINTDGRSSAAIAGWTARNESSFNHLSFSNRPESINDLGKVIAHELGHYTYGLFDEYVEAGKALDPAQPGSPSQSDTPKNTMMNDHLSFLSFSTPADYADSTQRQTAQARVWSTGPNLTGGSHWETLTRPVEQDPLAARNFGRTAFEAFRGMNPATLALARPVSGFDSRLNIIFVPAPIFRDVIVVDRTLPAERFAIGVQAAKVMVAQADASTQYAIVVSPPPAGRTGANAGTVLGFTPPTDEGKRSLAAALDALQPVATGVFDPLAAFTTSFTLVAADRRVGDPATLHVLTGAEATFPLEARETARVARIAVNALGVLGAPAPVQARAMRQDQSRLQSAARATVSLSQLSASTGGVYSSARNAADAGRDMHRAVMKAHSDPFSVLGFDASDRLVAGGVFDAPFLLASGATDGLVTAELFYNPVDANRLRFSLVAPNGTVYSPANLPPGITFQNDIDDGVADFVFAAELAGRAGRWIVRTQASAATSDAIALEVSTGAPLELSVDIDGGTVGATSGLIVRALLGSEKRVRGAVVTANIYKDDGTLVLANVAMRDDGIKPDTNGGDGLYFADLSGKLPAGDYFAVVSALSNAGSRIASLGNFIKGVREAELPVELFARFAEVSFSVEAGAPGTLGNNTPIVQQPPPIVQQPSLPAPLAAVSSGGGCAAVSNGRDAGLLLLLLFAVLGAFLRRRSRR